MAKFSSGIELIGDRKLRKLFRNLGPSVGRKVVRQALRPAVTPILKDARTNVRQVVSSRARSQRTASTKLSDGSRQKNDQGLFGAMKGARGRVIRKTRRGEQVYAIVGPKWPEGAHGHLIELGWRARSGRFVRGKPYLLPAWMSNKRKTLAIVQSKIASGTIREAQKLGR